MIGPHRPGIRLPGQRPVSWEAVVGIATVAGVIVGAVFGVASLMQAPENQAHTPENQPHASESVQTAEGEPADRGLELVDVEFSQQLEDVTVQEELSAGELHPVKTPGRKEQHRTLVVTLRNTGDDTAVLTAVKVVVLHAMRTPYCGSGYGGGISVSLDYDFRFSTDSLSRGSTWEPWSQTNSQNFAVAPHAVDALSITVGPDLHEPNHRVGDPLPLLWRFSVYGIFKGGKEAYWGDAIGISSELTPAGYRDAVLSPPGVGAEISLSEAELRGCANQALKDLELLTRSDQDISVISHPSIADLMGVYHELTKIVMD